ncbi:sugar ABC transporter substrate-binding protein [Streptomyces sioyaensis]|uniref:sugar ABC transporter substrate-binding protein n=1 Tax=Streptomyces sioyaensis TaxID=67364 RepID=UPI001F3AA08B|nr:sugar ABC transporter substrate-binding protein [Streptomyces sioyaensis]
MATAATALALVCGLAATGCGGIASEGGPRAGAGVGAVGVVLPTSTPFWQAYDAAIPPQAKAHGVKALPTVNSNSDINKQLSDIHTLLVQRVKGLVVAPVDTAAIRPGLRAAEEEGVPVVAVDAVPDSGKIAMAVRADNRAFGRKACHYLGNAVKTGKVVQIQGDLASVNGRERTNSFSTCMAKNYPRIKVLNIPAAWQAGKAAAGLEALYNVNPEIKGIYLQAGGAYLVPTLSILKRHNALFPVGDPRHITIVANDGIPQELDAIRKGEIDATVSQPVDLYAKYAMSYIKKAMQRQTFSPGPTDHGSTIVRLPNGLLEDQLPAPMVTKRNVNNPSLWGNRL